ncbi:hypothetical protein SDC9_95225 [bioreactor metagenome]|uniref:Uncharacterized protein n=1 Tax=bioreactor metagenome TaxID=1076179 RepID=A0A645A5Q1_9ZZZZ
MRHGAARQPGARAARDHRHVQRMAGAQHGLHLGFRFRQGHDQRALAIGGQPIAFIRRGVLGIPQQRMRRQMLAECIDDFFLAVGPFTGRQRLQVGRCGGCAHAVNVVQCASSRVEQICTVL